MIPSSSPAPVHAWTGAGGHRSGRVTKDSWARRHRWLWTLLALLGAAILLLIGSVEAAAHAEMQATTPANGAVLERAPGTVSVRFTESVQVGPDGVRVLAADGTRVDLGDAARSPDNPATVAATLRSGLADGTYTVAWRVTSADSHPIHGAFAFTVGAPGSGTGLLAGADQGSDPVISVLVPLSRGAGYAGLALLIGATGILILLGAGISPRRPHRLARTGAAIVFGSAVVSLLAQGPYAAGTGLGSLLDPDALRQTLSGRPGLAMLARAVLAMTVLALPALAQPYDDSQSTTRRSARSYAVWALLPAVALAATFSAAGHAMTGRQVPAAVVVDILHLTAMGLWLGGLVTLGALCVPATTPKPLGTTIRRFSTLAAWCVAVLVVTGVHQTARQVGSPADLLATGYGRLLVTKVVAVLLLIVLGYTARRWTQRHARPAGKPTAGAVHQMRRTLAVEAAIGIVVLALSALLSGTAPPREQTTGAPTATSSEAVTLEAHYDTGTGVEGTGTVMVDFVRTTPGRYNVDLRLTGPSGDPITPDQVSATWFLPANNLGPLPMTLAPRETGHWRAQASLIPTGDWLLTVKVRTSDFDEDSVTFVTSNAALDAPTTPVARPGGPSTPQPR